MNEGEGEGEGDDTIGEYDGERNEQKQRHGRGRALLPNSDYYEGEYKKGLRNGEGYYVFKGGAQYKGGYKQGIKDGTGTFYYPDGSIYQGEWKEDKRHGKGKYTYSHGDTYEGDWEKDERQGLGTYIYKTSGVIMFGIWEKGKMEGRGKITYPTFTFYGTFLHNMPIGKGCFVFENYCIQQGYYVHIRDEPVVAFEGGEEEVTREEEENMSPREGYPKGIKPIWRPRKILPYLSELIPPDPRLPAKPPPTPITSNEELLEIKEDIRVTLNGVKEGGPEDPLNQSMEDEEKLVENKKELKPIQEESSTGETLPPSSDERSNPTSPEFTDDTEIENLEN